MQLYKRLRREYEQGLGTIRGVAQKYNVHRRTVRAALKNAVPSKRKATPRKRPKMALAIPAIETILNDDLNAQFNQRHTARQIWEQLHIEIPGCDVGGSTYGRMCGSARLNWMELGPASSQIALAWMMKMLHSDVSCRSLKKIFQAAQCHTLSG